MYSNMKPYNAQRSCVSVRKDDGRILLYSHNPVTLDLLFISFRFFYVAVSGLVVARRLAGKQINPGLVLLRFTLKR